MEKFTVQYQDQTIQVETGNHYHLQFPDGQWMIIEKYPDDTKTTPVENENISYSTAFVWVVEDTSGADSLTNSGQLQVLGELIRKKEQELENS